MMRRPGTLLSKISLRLFLWSSSRWLPASASSGITSSRIRPFVSAITMGCSVKSIMLSYLLLPIGFCLSCNAANDCAQRLQFFLDTLVTAINMVNAINQGFVFCHQSCNYQTGRRTQVSGHNRRSLELRHPGHNHGIALHLHARTHTVHFRYVHKAVLKNGFCDGTGSFCNCVQSSELRLHVGR